LNPKSQLLLPLAVSLAVLQACGTVDQRNCDTQPAANVDTVTPVATKATAETPLVPMAAAPAAVPAPAPAPTVVQVAAAAPDAAPPPVATTKTDANLASSSVDRYTVLPGDTLASIAAKKEVYGDARLWPLLYRANVQLIGPQGVIYPNQVLVVGRNHTLEDINALTTRPKRAMPPAPAVAKAPAAPAPVATPLAEAKVADLKQGESKPAESKQAIPPAGDAPKGAPAVGGPVMVKPAEYLSSARRAFAAGDGPWAIYYYSVYLDQKNDDANAWGELGNIYYFDGNLPDAAKAYYNAANLLIDRGQTARAIELIPVIEEGEPGLSEALYQRLTTIKR
jgi:hypothetical protein